ncbi:MAG: GGDEF domain-containing protein [Spirochaetia bacterium]|nr:GGDEF domain-containing protein [Spirochaetia bacterium]
MFYIIVSVIILPATLFSKKHSDHFIDILAIIVTFLYFLNRSFSQLHNAEHLIWIPIFPLLYFFLLNKKWGSFLSSVSLLIYIFSYYFYEQLNDIKPAGHAIFIQSISAYLITAVISYFFEHNWIRTQKDLQVLSEIDFLTNILNRRGLENKFLEYLDIASRYKENLSVIQFDLDKFKKINDTYGHETGDKVLSELAAFIARQIRKSDLFGRLGGEEFIIIVRQVKANSAKKMADKFRKEIEIHKFANLHITASFGVTEYLHGETMQKMISRADRAMYRSKLKRNCVTVL